MTWNYRLVKAPCPEGLDDIHLYEIHEVYYNDKGEPTAMTEKPITIDSVEESDAEEARQSIVRDLKMMLHDMETHPVFIPPKEWAELDD